MFNNCMIYENKNDDYSNPNFTHMNAYLLIQWLEFTLIVLLQPILSVIGLFNNTLIIAIIKNRSSKKVFKDPMYYHILMNAWFNMAYCVTMLLKLVNICMRFSPNIAFCSSVYQSYSAQYFKIVFVHFLGNVFKFCSNMSYLLFSFSRFMLISDLKKKSVFKMLLKCRASLLFTVIFGMGCILSAFKLFQYRVNTEESRDFPYESRDESYCLVKANKSQCRVFNSLKVAYKCLNDVVCVALVVAIDLCLVTSFNRHLENKSRHIIDVDHHKHIRESKKNIKWLIGTNVLIYFVSNVPEFVSTVMLVCFAKRIATFCRDKVTSCDLINEEAQVFNMISIVCQLFVFVKFDKNCRTSLKDLLARFVWLRMFKS